MTRATLLLTLGVDFSQGADLAPATLQAWWDAGVRHLYVQYSAKLKSYLFQVENWSAQTGHRFTVDVYVYLYFPLSPWGQTPEARVFAALQACVGHEVRRVWLDVEDPYDTAPPADVVAALLRCGHLVRQAGLEPGIYSGYYTYRAHTDDSSAFSDLGWPLWHADYLGDAPIPDLSREPVEMRFRYRPYGGWEKPTVWQWWNTTTFGDHSVDLDVEEEPEEDEMFNVLAYGLYPVTPEVNGSQLNVQDLGLPLGAKRYRLQVFYTDHERPVAFYHGLPDPGNRDAGRVYPPYGIVEVIADEDGFFWVAGEHEVLVSPLGYYT